jgi:Plasmid pRiA4b ORF-3-like protein
VVLSDSTQNPLPSVKHATFGPVQARRRPHTTAHHARFYHYRRPVLSTSPPSHQSKPITHRPCSGLLQYIYTYDFGDGWEHGIVLEKGLPLDPNMAYPLCMSGRGACPPEDCGGIGGFYNLLEALQNPRHPQHEELLEWVGEDYDPEKFSIEAINQTLHGRKKRAARSSG